MFPFAVQMSSSDLSALFGTSVCAVTVIIIIVVRTFTRHQQTMTKLLRENTDHNLRLEVENLRLQVSALEQKIDGLVKPNEPVGHAQASTVQMRLGDG